MTNRLLLVRAQWDDTAAVWVATSDDVPGLVTEADTFEALRDKVLALVPELMADNSVRFDANTQPVHIIAEQTARVPALAPCRRVTIRLCGVYWPSTAVHACAKAKVTTKAGRARSPAGGSWSMARSSPATPPMPS